MNGVKEMTDFIRERCECVEPDGALVLLSLGHYKSDGSVQEVHTVSRKAAGNMPWDDPKSLAERAAEMFDAMSRRYAAGLLGSQQFVLTAAHGETCKTTRTLPFLRAGATSVGPGGLGTEAPTPTGVLQTGTRWGELVLTGASRKEEMFISALGGLLDKTLARLDTIEKRSDDQWLALKNALLEIQNNAATQAMKAVQLELTRKIITLLPGLANMLSGKELFPQGVVEESMFDTIVRNFSGEEQQALVQLVQSHPQGKVLGGVFTDSLLRAKRRAQSEAAEIDRATKGVIPKPASYEEAEHDAAGRIERVLQGGTFERALPGRANGHTNGSANGTANGHSNGTTAAKAPAPVNASAVEGAAILDELLNAESERLGAMLSILRMNGQHDLAARIEAYHQAKGK